MTYLAAVADITAWIPDHAYYEAPTTGRSACSWMWTTPEGTWTVVVRPHPGCLELSGPRGQWDFTGDPEIAVGRLHAVLLALDALPVPDPTPWTETPPDDPTPVGEPATAVSGPAT